MSEKSELGLMDIFVNPMKVTMKQFFKSTFGKPTTVMYPLERRVEINYGGKDTYARRHH